MTRTRSVVPRHIGTFLCLCLISVHLTGCKTDLRPANEAAAGSSTPAPYLPTGIPQVVVVSGTDREMGVQYGQQAAAAIVHNIALLKSRLYDAYGRETVTRDMGAWDYYLTRYDPSYRDWLQGIAEGCTRKGYEVSYPDLVALMIYPTQVWARPKTPYPAETKAGWMNISPSRPLAGPHHSCNSFAATGSMTPDGKTIHAITSMAETELMDNIILIAFPVSGISFVAQTYAGRLSSNFAMNSKGFAWTMTAILSDSPAWGVPPEVYFHYLAQKTASPAEALKYLESTPRGGVTGGFILSDASGGISVYEGTSDHFHRRRPGDRGEPGPFVVQTNHLVDPSLEVYNPKWLPTIGTYARYDTVFQYLKEARPGTVDFNFAKKLFASDDWYDAGKMMWVRNQPGAKEISNSHTSVGQAVFIPAERTAYLQAGTPSGIGLPAFATGEYVKIKLADDPKAVTQQADRDALAFYWDARDAYEHDLNDKAGHLTQAISGKIRSRLDEAISSYSLGMDRASFANLETDESARIALYAEAMTYYAKSQLYAQMAKTALRGAGKAHP
jgi:hypothetical protein